MSLGVYVVGGLFAGLMLSRVGSGSRVSVPKSLSERQRKFRCAFSATGLGDDWLRFFEQTAYRESKFNPLASNTRASEVKASKKVADRVGTVDGINFSTWGFGSRGLFQFLGPIIAVRGGRLRFPRALTEKRMGYDPGISIAAALNYAAGLMQWDNFQGSWASINLGWGNPSKMGDPGAIEESARIMEERGAKIGWAPGWARKTVSGLKLLDPSQMQALAVTARSYYERC